MSADFDGDQTHCFLFVIIESASANAPGAERERMSLNHDPTRMSIAGLVRRRRWSCFLAWSIAWGACRNLLSLRFGALFHRALLPT
jgi:hypothetical protein